MTVFECIAAYVCNNGNMSDEEYTAVENVVSFEQLKADVEKYIGGTVYDMPFRLEDHTSGEIVGTWDSMTAFFNDDHSYAIFYETVHTQFDCFDKYDNFAGNVWLI